MVDKTTKEALKTLRYSENWLKTGILTEQYLFEQIKQYELGEDTNTEHYRYQTLMSYLKSISSFNETIISDIFSLIITEEDIDMASSVAIGLLKIKCLTEMQFYQVANFLKNTFGEWTIKHINKELERRKYDSLQ